MFKLHIYLDIIKNNKSRSLFLKRNTSLKGIGMNKIYKIVWNAYLGAWVAVSEIAKGKTKVNSGTVGDIVIDQKNEITIKNHLITRYCMWRSLPCLHHPLHFLL